MTTTHPIVRQLREGGPTLSVGLVSADLMALGKDVARLEQAGATIAHFDVMDGCYVPMLTVGPSFIRAVRTRMLKDVHLMIREPGTSVADYVAAGADIITVHPDACRHPHRVLQQIGSMTHAHDAARQVARGVALNPGIPVNVIEPLVDEIDLVMLVAINPGFGGQQFLPATLGRIEAVQRVIAAAGRDILLAVDGGITKANINQLAGRGVDMVITGSAVFDGDISANIDQMTRALRG